MSIGTSCLNVDKPLQLTELIFCFLMHLVEKYCGLGLKVEKLIETSDHLATVQFMSGTHHTGRGFYLSYSTTDHAGTPQRHASFHLELRLNPGYFAVFSFLFLEVLKAIAHSDVFKTFPGNTC